jgi:hypothetical protein
MSSFFNCCGSAYDRDNAISISWKLLLVISLADRTISIRRNCMENEEAKLIDSPADY